MALKDYLGVIDNALKHVFDRKAVDPAKARRPLLRGIDRALAQFKSGSTGTPTGWYRVKNGVVALTVKVGTDTFDINGVATNHMPADRFEEFLGAMRAAFEAGEFDAELANKGHGDAEVAVPKARTSTISSEAAKQRGIKAAATRKAIRESQAPGVRSSVRPCGQRLSRSPRRRSARRERCYGHGGRASSRHVRSNLVGHDRQKRTSSCRVNR